MYNVITQKLKKKNTSQCIEKNSYLWVVGRQLHFVVFFSNFEMFSNRYNFPS